MKKIILVGILIFSFLFPLVGFAQNIQLSTKTGEVITIDSSSVVYGFFSYTDDTKKDASLQGIPVEKFFQETLRISEALSSNALSDLLTRYVKINAPTTKEQIELISKFEELFRQEFEKTGNEEKESSIYYMDEQFLYTWAYSQYLTNTKNVEDFRSGDQITREEVAAVIYRALKNKIFNLPKGSTGAKKAYIDAKNIAPEFREAIAFLQEKGVMKGDSRGQFRPKDTISVRESIIIASRLAGASLSWNDDQYINFFTNMTDMEYQDYVLSEAALRHTFFSHLFLVSDL